MSALSENGTGRVNCLNLSSSPSSRDFVGEIVRRCQEMDDCMDSYNRERMIVIAKQIYLDGLQAIREKVRGFPGEVVILTPIVVAFNKVIGNEMIQHDKAVLLSMVKAHRVMTELMWMQLFDQEETIRTTTRDQILTITAILKTSISNKLTNADLHHEVNCLEQVAKWLVPSSGILSGFLLPAASAIAAGASLNAENLIHSIHKIIELTKKEWPFDWYIHLLSFQWMATNITTIEQFEQELEPHLGSFIDKGSRHTLSLVNILKTIFDNSESEPPVKHRAFQELLKLVAIKPEFHITDVLNHPNQMVEALLKQQDRYAKTRIVASKALCEIGLESGGESYRTTIKSCLVRYKSMIRDLFSNKYIEEKKEAEARLIDLKRALESSDRRKEELETDLFNTLQSSFRGSETIEGKEEKQGQLNDEIDQIEAESARLSSELIGCSRMIELAIALENLENDESAFLEELDICVGEW